LDTQDEENAANKSHKDRHDAKPSARTNINHGSLSIIPHHLHRNICPSLFLSHGLVLPLYLLIIFVQLKPPRKLCGISMLGEEMGKLASSQKSGKISGKFFIPLPGLDPMRESSSALLMV
jgi:hypothetical protein